MHGRVSTSHMCSEPVRNDLSTLNWKEEKREREREPPPPPSVLASRLYFTVRSKRAAKSRRDQEVRGELDSHEEVILPFAGPGEIKRREVVLDPQAENPGEIKSREVELVSESWTSFASFVLQQTCYGHCPCDSAPHGSWLNSNCVLH